jgi:hypothetical protein
VSISETMSAQKISVPSFMVIAGEALTPLELARLTLALPSLSRQQRGNGEPVIVLPGLGASNVSTIVLRQYLSWLGYQVHGWTLGRNDGNVSAMLPLVAKQLEQFHASSKAKVSIVGWSLGGVLAREVARDYPSAVSQVITMGSPIVGGPKYTTFGKFYARGDVDLDAIEVRIAQREQRPIRVPLTSIYSKRDGVVAWQASIDKLNHNADNIEVKATHLGMGISPDVFKIIARKLASK